MLDYMRSEPKSENAKLQVCLYSVPVCPACESNNSAINQRTMLLGRQLSNQIMFPDASSPKRNFCICNLHKSGNDALHNGGTDGFSIVMCVQRIAEQISVVQ
jgi:hypothetical protein